MTEIQTFDSVWDAIADTPQQAANLRARAELMRQIAAIIKANIAPIVRMRIFTQP